MKRKLIAVSMTMALLLSIFSAASVGAHNVKIESAGTPPLVPSRSEWFGLQPDQSGEAIIQRDASQQGELIYNDAGKDNRAITLTPIQVTDQVTRETDLDWFGVTADANNLYFVAKPDLYRGIQNDPSIELLITIDTNHTSGTGTQQIPLGTASYAATNVPADAAWEFAVDTSFRKGTPTSGGFVSGKTVIWTNTTAKTTCTTCSSQLASAAINVGSFAEIAVPWAALPNAKPTGANYLRFTVSIMYSPNNESDLATRPVPADGFNSPIADFLGTEKTPAETLATLQSGTLKDTSVFDIHLDTNGTTPTYEPYAPLRVTEFQPNPIGTDNPGPTNTSTESEWIEIYNPNTFAITNLSDYKIGNAAKRGSSQGMFKFKNNVPLGGLAAGGTIVIARFKTRFQAGHPGFTGTLLDLQTDLTPYNWGNGATIDLDNGPNAPATTFEEQVLILDGKDDIVDMATYGNPTTPYPGSTPIPISAVPEGYSYERCPASFDTNNSSAEFVVHTTPAAQTPGTACVGRPGIDMTIAKTGPVNIRPGDPVQFTLSYANVGTAADTVNTVTITDTLPAGLTFTPNAGNAVPEPTSINGSTLTWVLPAPAPGGAQGTISLTTASGAGLGTNVPLVNTAGIVSANEQATAKGNNAAAWTVTTLGPADLSISSNLAGPVPPGQQFTFTMTYQNTGQDDATGVTISDVLPAGVTLISEDSPDATFIGRTTGTAVWDVGTVPANTSGTITVVAQVASSTPANTSLENIITISADGTDPTPDNNSEKKSFTVGFHKLYLAIIHN